MLQSANKYKNIIPLLTKIRFWASPVIKYLMNSEKNVNSVGLLTISFMVMVTALDESLFLEGVIASSVIE